MRWRDVLAPHLGLLAGLVVVALSWDPAAIGGLGQRIALAGALVVLSLGICVALDRPLRASMARIATGVAARGADDRTDARRRPVTIRRRLG